MLRRLVIFVALLTLVPLSGTARAGASPGGWIVVLDDSADAGAVSAVRQRASALGGSVTGFFDRLGALSVRLRASDVNALRSNPHVAYVVADGPVQLFSDAQPEAASGDAAVGASSRVPPGVARIGAARPRVNDISDGGSEPKTAVAVLDTGVHRRPELNVVGGHDCAGDPFSNLFGGDDIADRNGHGTHVAGIIGARASDTSVFGVWPGAPIYAVRVFPRFGSAQVSNIVCGLDWVAQHGAELGIKVVNMSLGGEGNDDGACGMKDRNALHTAVCRVVEAGVTVVVAAGNHGGDLAKTVPASFSEVLAVTAMASYTGVPGGHGTPPAGCRSSSPDDAAADFSAYAVPGGAATAHVIAAPGVCITSTWNDGGTKTISGTSMAAPHVSGLVARCIEAGPCSGLSPAEIVAKLRADAVARPAEEGFVGDSRHPIPGKYFGDLATVAGY